MALDRPDDDFDDFDRPERQVPGGDVPARRPEPPESRSREEYYEALRAASEGETADDGREAADADRSGWDSVDAEDRPKAEDIHVTPERTTHILDGEPGWRRASARSRQARQDRVPGKLGRDERVIATSSMSHAGPTLPPTHQDWNNTLAVHRYP